ncbi:hypothetical protein DFP72DRAFT_901414 [Ephemerocybe angulata]|uniref:Uncharacterized protein n=1 Tax=Ephemerocybe angulata TaxID=980116 RepID=A0A8H6HWD1_9AGAR|nr:hypothetical protein DFP72DRAFT_901414 [Tulosesus angulatus]
MTPIIPRELIDLCIAASSDCFPTLLQVSLVSKECASEARKYVFKEINLDRRDRSVDEYSYYIQTLVNLLESNRMLGNCVRTLILPLDPSIIATSKVYTQDLPAILKYFASLEMLSALPDPLKQSIGLCCSASSISRLAFVYFLNFPGHLLQSAPNLTTLALAHVDSGPEAGSQSVPAAACIRPSYAESRLTTLTVYDASSVMHSCILADPKWISQLKQLSCHILTQEDLTFCCRLIRECAASLKELIIDFQFIENNSPIHLGDMISLPEVTKLTVGSRVELQDHTEGDPDPGPESQLPLFLDILRSQPNTKVFIIDIKVRIPSSHITSSEAPPALRDREAWKAIDEYLSSETMTVPVETVLIFTIGWVGRSRTDSDEQQRLSEAEEIIPLKSQLLREVHEVLPRTVKAERVWMIIDDEPYYMGPDSEA